MKRIVLTLCIFIALSSLANADFVQCRDKNGNTIFTNTTPPPDYVCEGSPGYTQNAPAATPKTPISRQKRKKSNAQPNVKESNTEVEITYEIQGPPAWAIQQARDNNRKAEAANRDVQARRTIGRQAEAANARIDAAIDSIKNNKANYYKGGGLRPGATDQIVDLEKSRLRDTRSDARIDDLINSIKNNPSNSYNGGGLRPKATEQIVDLEKARLRLQENQSDAGLNMRNQQDDMETKMKRQQREMEAKRDAMNAEISRQNAQMMDLQHHQSNIELNQRINTIYGR